ncbi:MAG TPA: ParB/RepB/Spo0J family partition protein [Spirochaetia bacterium]|nr:ParB/RepB/Spo0J family partition protein [Spirochaetia bacterium]
MRIKIDTIIVKKRIRKDLRDLEALMESMRKFGQLSPIIINRNNELLAGERRLTAALKLGWNTIDAVVIDKEDDIDMLEIELEENISRNDLTNEEVAEGYRRLDSLRNPGFFRRIINFFKRLWRRIFGKK